MTTALIVVIAIVLLSALLSLGSMGIFYVIRKRGLRRTTRRGSSSGGGALATRCEFMIDDDISNGRELHKLPAISYSRHDSAPNDFHYITEHVTIDPVGVDTSLKNMTCCKCLDDCSGANCECVGASKCGQYYDTSGKLKLDYMASSCGGAIRECNIACKCNRKLCKNMVIQGGCQLRLVLFKTKSRGWGVRTLEHIERGTFVGVYSGELVSVAASQNRQDDTYLFNLANTIIRYERPANDKQQNGQEIVNEANVNHTDYNNNDGQPHLVGVDETIEQQDTSGEQQVLVNEKVEEAKQEHGEWECVGQRPTQQQQQQGEDGEEYEQEAEAEEEEEQVEIDQQGAAANQGNTREEYFICDAKFYGNFTRFINHSCEPNVIGIRTFTAHQDHRFPYISFFANQDIQAGEELTLNYGDNYWLVKCKRDKVYCLCKKSTCKFTKKTLNQTLKAYYEQRQIAANSQ